MKSILCLLILLSISMLPYLAEAKRVEGTINTDDKWVYLTKFAFHPGVETNNTWTNEGHLVFEIENFNATVVPNLRLYYYMWLDGHDEHWLDIYNNRNHMTCDELVAKADDNRILFANYSDHPFAQKFPRYWFIAIADCKSNGFKDFKYKLHIYNTDSDWGKEISFDQQDLPGLYLFYFLLYLVGLAAHIYGIYTLYRSDFLHPVVKILSATIFLYFISIFCLFIHWMSYKNNGVGSPFFLGAGEFLDFLSQILFTLLLLLIAKGWAISTTEVTEKKILGAVIGIFCILYLAIFIFAWAKMDPASTLYIYETGPGIALLVIRALTLGYFIWSLRHGVLHESHPSKRRFYQIFTAVYTAWFLSLHLIVIVAAIRNPEQRIRTVEPFYVTVNTIALAILAFLFWPSQIVKYFDVRPGDGLLSGSTSSPYETL